LRIKACGTDCNSRNFAIVNAVQQQQSQRSCASLAIGKPGLLNAWLPFAAMSNHLIQVTRAILMGRREAWKELLWPRD